MDDIFGELKKEKKGRERKFEVIFTLELMTY